MNSQAVLGKHVDQIDEKKKKHIKIFSSKIMLLASDKPVKPRVLGRIKYGNR